MKPGSCARLVIIPRTVGTVAAKPLVTADCESPYVEPMLDARDGVIHCVIVSINEFAMLRRPPSIWMVQPRHHFEGSRRAEVRFSLSSSSAVLSRKTAAPSTMLCHEHQC